MNMKQLLLSLIEQVFVSVLYFLIAVIALQFAVVEGNAALLWPSSGFALAIVVRFGVKYVFGVFIGALVMSLYIGNPHFVSAAIAFGNTLEPLIAWFILRKLPFSANLFNAYDYFSLIFAGIIGAAVSSVFGVLSLYLAGIVGNPDFLLILVYWWLGNVLGIVLVAPFILLFNYKVYAHLLKNKKREIILLMLTSFGFSLIVFTDWYSDWFMNIKGSFFLTIPLAWAALRFNQNVLSIVIFQFFIVGVWGLLNKQGIFINNLQEPNLILFNLCFIVITIISLMVAYAINQRNILYQAVNTSKIETYIFCKRNMRFEFVNEVALDNLGVSFSEALNLNPIDIKAFYSKKDFLNLIEPLVKGQVKQLNYESTHQRKDGTLYPVEITLQSIMYADRDCFLLSVFDISERQEREHHQILGNRVCDISPQAIMIASKDNKIIRVNDSFVQLTGYLAKEVIGKNPNVLSSGRHNKVFYQKLWETLLKENSWQGEIYNRRKNGELYLQHLTIKLLHDSKGYIQNYIGLFTDISEEREENIHLKKLSEHDVLTELPNRLKLRKEFDYALAMAKRHKNQLALLFCDLNDFKQINDNYGHTVGDEVLQIISRRMNENIRNVDLVARIGGDEFVILMTDVKTESACLSLISKLKSAIVQPMVITEHTFEISASFGYAMYPEQGHDFDALFHASDIDMYKDKIKSK